MQHVRLSARARSLIRAAALNEFRETAVNIDSEGNADVPLSDEVMERLESHRMDGESISDVIERILSPKQ